MIEVDILNIDNEVQCTLQLDSIHGRIKAIGKDPKVGEGILEDSFILYDEGEDKDRRVYPQKEPLEFMTNAYKMITGSYCRATLPRWKD